MVRRCGAEGGELVLLDAAGKPRVTIGADGIAAKSAAGATTWSSTSAAQPSE